MRTKNVRRPSFRAHGSSIFSGRPTARNLARDGTQTSDTFGYNTRSESPRRLGRGLDNAEGIAPDRGRAAEGRQRVNGAMRWARINTMGHRATKKVTTNGTLTEHRRFLYRG